jgi:hypothetical protein
VDRLKHSNRHRSNYRRKNKSGGGGAYPLIVGGMVLVAGYAVLNPDKMPGRVQQAASVYQDIGRDHAAPSGAYYFNCDEARAAGVAPIHAGESGYRDDLDADGDGIACEPYRGQ